MRLGQSSSSSRRSFTCGGKWDRRRSQSSDYIDKVGKQTGIAKVVGSGGWVLAGGLTLAGGVMTVLTAGAALPVLAAGAGLGLASGLTGASAALYCSPGSKVMSECLSKWESQLRGCVRTVRSQVITSSVFSQNTLQQFKLKEEVRLSGTFWVVTIATLAMTPLMAESWRAWLEPGLNVDKLGDWWLNIQTSDSRI